MVVMTFWVWPSQFRGEWLSFVNLMSLFVAIDETVKLHNPHCEATMGLTTVIVNMKRYDRAKQNP